MTNDKSASPKSTPTTSGKATPALPNEKDDVNSAPVIGAKQIGTEPQANTAPTPLTKMQVATEIFTKMCSSPGTTRKAIIDQFVAEAKLSKAGASTYYQLIKAKVK